MLSRSPDRAVRLNPLEAVAVLKVRLTSPEVQVWLGARGDWPPDKWQVLTTWWAAYPIKAPPQAMKDGRPWEVAVCLESDADEWVLTAVEPAGAHVEVVNLICGGFKVDLYALHSLAEIARRNWQMERVNAER